MIKTLTSWNPFTWLRRLGYSRYEMIDGRIVMYEWGRTKGSIELAKITSWYFNFEMLFDSAIIRFGDDGELVWLDYKNDLLAILRGELRNLEINCP